MEQQVKYEGGAFNEKFKRGKSSGYILLTGTFLRFVTETGGIDLPLQGLEIEQGGASNRLLFFKHNAYPGWTVFTADKSILKETRLSGRDGTAKQVSGIRRGNVRRRTLTLVTLLVIAVLIFGVFELRKPLTKKIAEEIPADWEQTLGDTVFSQYKITHKFVDDPQVKQVVAEMTAPLLEYIPQEKYRYKIHIVEDPTVNAFALPGGNIVIHTGLLVSVESAEELLGVLAHEIAHVALQHGIRHIIDSAGIFIIIQALFGDVSGALAVIIDNSSFLVNRKFSRKFEQEADEQAFSYLVAANINPMGLVDFFTRLLDDREKNEVLKVVGTIEDSLSFISTHPAAKQRIAYLNRKWAHYERKTGFISFEKEFNQFQDLVNTKFIKNKKIKKKEEKNEDRT